MKTSFSNRSQSVRIGYATAFQVAGRFGYGSSAEDRMKLRDQGIEGYELEMTDGQHRKFISAA